MPSLNTHRKLTAIAAVTLLPASLNLDSLSFLALEAGVLITLLPEFGPDLDISHRHFGALGDFIGLKSYAKLVPHRFGTKKRHWKRFEPWKILAFSHIPFFGTLPRFILLCLPVLLICLLFGTIPKQILWWGLFILLGMSYSDLWHFAADKIMSDWKETKRKWWRTRIKYGSGRSQYRR